MKDKESTKKKMPLWGKILIVIGGLAVFFVIFFLVIDTHVIAGYKQFMRRNMNAFLSDNERSEKTEMRVMEDIEFDELEKRVPFKVPKPTWLPENYELDHIDLWYNSESYSIIYKYININDTTKHIEIVIDTYVMSKSEEGITVDYEKVEVGDMEVVLLNFDNSAWQSFYINEQGFRISITIVEDRETLLKLIENIN